MGLRLQNLPSGPQPAGFNGFFCPSVSVHSWDQGSYPGCSATGGLHREEITWCKCVMLFKWSVGPWSLTISNVFSRGIHSAFGHIGNGNDTHNSRAVMYNVFIFKTMLTSEMF